MKIADSVGGLPAIPGRSLKKITRRFAVASLFALAVAVVLGTTAPASAAPKWYMKGTFVNVGDEPHAAGWWGINWFSSANNYLEVRCRGLTPGARYIVAGAGGSGFTADHRGQGGFVTRNYAYGGGYQVYRVEATGYVLVLE